MLLWEGHCPVPSRYPQNILCGFGWADRIRSILKRSRDTWNPLVWIYSTWAGLFNQLTYTTFTSFSYTPWSPNPDSHWSRPWDSGGWTPSSLLVFRVHKCGKEWPGNLPQELSPAMRTHWCLMGTGRGETPWPVHRSPRIGDIAWYTTPAHHNRIPPRGRNYRRSISWFACVRQFLVSGDPAGSPWVGHPHKRLYLHWCRFGIDKVFIHLPDSTEGYVSVQTSAHQLVLDRCKRDGLRIFVEHVASVITPP